MSKLTSIKPSHGIEREWKKNPITMYKGKRFILPDGVKYSPFEFARALQRTRAASIKSRATGTIAERKARMRARLERAESNLIRSTGRLLSVTEPTYTRNFSDWLRNGDDY